MLLNTRFNNPYSQLTHRFDIRHEDFLTAQPEGRIYDYAFGQNALSPSLDRSIYLIQTTLAALKRGGGTAFFDGSETEMDKLITVLQQKGIQHTVSRLTIGCEQNTIEPFPRRRLLSVVK